MFLKVYRYSKDSDLLLAINLLNPSVSGFRRLVQNLHPDFLPIFRASDKNKTPKREPNLNGEFAKID